MSNLLFHALAAEHKQNRGHDIFNQGKLNHIASSCDVCLYLHAEWREYQDAEREYYEEQTAPQDREKVMMSENEYEYLLTQRPGGWEGGEKPRPMK